MPGGPAAQAAEARLPLGDALLLAGFCLAAFLPFLHAMPFVDGVRDIAIALAIARGESYPLVGPIFGSSFHLGPVFHYLQAVPLLLGLPVASVPWWMGALASSKFLLAYGLGRAWMDRRFGLLFAAALALPGWSGLDFLNTTTPMLVPALLLGTCWSALAHVRGGRALTLIGTGLLASLAIQAHPSAAVLAVFPLSAATAAAIRRGQWPALGAGVAAGLLPFLPVALAWVVQGASAVVPAGQVVVQAGSGHSGWGWLEAAYGFACGGPLTTLRTLGGESWGGMVACATVLLATGGLALCARQARRDRRARWLLAGLTWVAVMVFGVRPSTPWYFAQVLTLSYAGVIALGWRSGPWAGRALPGAALALALIQTAAVMQHVGRGEGGFPAAELMDIRQARGNRGPQAGAWIAVSQWADLAQIVCPRLRGTLALHGTLASIVDEHGGLPIRDRCDVSTLRLGGAADRHLVGVPRAVWSPLGWSPLHKIGSLGLFEPDGVRSMSPGHPLADARDYPMRAPIGAVATTRTMRIDVAPGSLVIIGRLSPSLSVFEVASVRADQLALAPAYRDAHIHAYVVPASVPHPVTLSLQVLSTDHDWIDVVEIAPPAANRQASR